MASVAASVAALRVAGAAAAATLEARLVALPVVEAREVMVARSRPRVLVAAAEEVSAAVAR